MKEAILCARGAAPGVRQVDVLLSQLMAPLIATQHLIVDIM